MKFIKLKIQGAYLIESDVHEDVRGTFVKVFNNSIFSTYEINEVFSESFYSISSMNVIRGMHFQLPPYDCSKLVYVAVGSVLDVILDLRVKSDTYGNYQRIHLNKSNQILYVPKGCAHGFLSLNTHSFVVYMQSCEFNKKADSGILWNSFGFDWDGIREPIISSKDMELIDFNKFNSPF